MENQAQFEKLLAETKQKNEYCKTLTDEVKKGREELKSILDANNLKEYSNDTASIKIIDVDKSSFSVNDTINYLKNNGLERFIHTKEYFDESELAMAIVKGEIDPKALAQFSIEKHEYRVLIK